MSRVGFRLQGIRVWGLGLRVKGFCFNFGDGESHDVDHGNAGEEEASVDAD